MRQPLLHILLPRTIIFTDQAFEVCEEFPPSAKSQVSISMSLYPPPLKRSDIRFRASVMSSAFTVFLLA